MRQFSVACMIGALVAFWPRGMEAADGSGQSLALSLRGNSLSVRIDQVPLGRVLAALAEQVGVTVHLVGPAAEGEVSVDFQNLPLEEGVDRIVGGRNYVLTYTRAPAATERLGSGRAKERRVGAGVAESSTSEGIEDSAVGRPGGKIGAEELRALQEWVRELGTAPEQAVRDAAPQASEEQGDEDENEVLAVIIAALRDEDPQVRAATLKLLGEANTALLLGPLAEGALSAASPQPLKAQESRSERDEDAAVDVLRQGLRGSDPRLGTLAQDLLEILEEMDEEEGKGPSEVY